LEAKLTDLDAVIKKADAEKRRKVRRPVDNLITVYLHIVDVL
jgi:hypothetical protein